MWFSFPTAHGTTDDADVAVDPIKPALAMHTGDLRSDLDGNQTVDVYSIFAFDSSEAGKNAMKGIAAFGGFTEDTSCGTTGFPYNFTSDSPAGEYTPANCEAPCTGSKQLCGGPDHTVIPLCHSPRATLTILVARNGTRAGTNTRRGTAWTREYRTTISSVPRGRNFRRPS